MKAVPPYLDTSLLPFLIFSPKKTTLFKISLGIRMKAILPLGNEYHRGVLPRRASRIMLCGECRFATTRTGFLGFVGVYSGEFHRTTPFLPAIGRGRGNANGAVSGIALQKPAKLAGRNEIHPPLSRKGVYHTQFRRNASYPYRNLLFEEDLTLRTVAPKALRRGAAVHAIKVIITVFAT